MKQTPKDVRAAIVLYVNARPEGTTALDVAKRFNMFTNNAGHKLGTLTRQGKIRRGEKKRKPGGFIYFPKGQGPEAPPEVS